MYCSFDLCKIFFQFLNLNISRVEQMITTLKIKRIYENKKMDSSYNDEYFMISKKNILS